MTPRYLSPHFIEQEFQCQCGCGKITVTRTLIASLETLRSLIGKPIHISSGSRCWSHNKAEGGSPKSQHLCQSERGTWLPTRAADIYVHGMTPEEIYPYVLRVEEFFCGGIGVYDEQNFVHVDVRDGKSRWRVRTDGGDYEAIPAEYGQAQA